MLKNVLFWSLFLIPLVYADTKLTDGSNEVVEYEERDGKFFPIVKVVTFKNIPCDSKESKEIGTCYGRNECGKLGGKIDGDCAKGFGVCCVFSVTCGGTVTQNNTYFRNPSYPSADTTGTNCMLTIDLEKKTTQLEVELETFQIAPPFEGNCNNDSFTVSGVNQGIVIPTLCGDNDGKTIFLDVDNTGSAQVTSTSTSTGYGKFKFHSSPSTTTTSYRRTPVNFMFTLGNDITFDRLWNIRIARLTDKDPCKAPPNCLQYERDIFGSIMSFNFDMTAGGELINDQCYAICFAYIPGYCQIEVNYSQFDVGDLDNNNQCTTDIVAGQIEQLCGSFTNRIQTFNQTKGPAILYINTDSDNTMLDSGFLASYTYKEC